MAFFFKGFRSTLNVWMKVIFREKSLLSLFRILRQELTTVLPVMWCCFTTAKGAENWSRAIHVRPRGFERCTAIFGASFAGLFLAVQAPCCVASNWMERHGSTPQIYTTLDHILAHLLVSPTWYGQGCEKFHVFRFTWRLLSRNRLHCSSDFLWIIPAGDPCCLYFNVEPLSQQAI